MSSAELHRLLAEAPLVHALARSLAAGDADDVAQETWLRAMGRDAAVDRPRSWLTAIVRRVVTNHRRERTHRAQREQAAARTEAVPSTAELLQREERRRALVTAVAALPEPLRAVIVLRFFEEVPPRAIASRLGLPVTTVWNRQRQGLALLRARLDDEHGDRRAWLAPLVALRQPAPTTTAATAAAGATVLLASHTKVLTLAVVGLLATTALLLWGTGVLPSGPTPPPGRAVPPTLSARLPDEPRDVPSAAAPSPPVRETLVPAAAAATGSLVVRASEHDGTPAADLGVLLRRQGTHHRLGVVRIDTDLDGVARANDLRPGTYIVGHVLQTGLTTCEVAAGRTTEVALELPIGIELRGVVVDADGLPVAGAEILVSPPAQADRDVMVVALSDGRGRFDVRACAPRCIVGARAAGHATSPMKLVYLQEGASRELRLELAEPGGVVEGTVLGPDGSPAGDAIVLVGNGRCSSLLVMGDRAPPPATLVRTDADGRFRAVGVPLGDQPIRVRTVRAAPWTGSCPVVAGVTSRADVRLQPGASVAGRVVDAHGAPVGGAGVVFGERYAWDSFDSTYDRTDGDGAFVLEGLPAGQLTITATESRREARAGVRAMAGETVRCELRLNEAPPAEPSPAAAERSGPEPAVVRRSAPRGHIVGRIVGPDGEPWPQVVLEGRSSGGSRTGLEPAAPSGAFDLHVPAGTWRLCLQPADAPWVWTGWEDVGPDRTVDLGTIRVPAGGSIAVRLHGDDDLLQNLNLWPWNDELTGSSWFTADGDAYRSTPLAPGRYLVDVYGIAGKAASPTTPAVAAQVVTVDVRAGECTSVDVGVTAGTFVRLEPDAPATDGPARLRVERDGVPVFVSGDAKTGLTLGLAPGAYTITVTAGGIDATTSFRVGPAGAGTALPIVTYRNP